MTFLKALYVFQKIFISKIFVDLMIYFQLKLLSITINADFSKINQTVFEQVYNVTEEDKSSAEEVKGLSAMNLTEVQLKDLENSLSKDLTPIQTKRAIDILRAFCESVTAKEVDTAVVSYQFKVVK